MDLSRFRFWIRLQLALLILTFLFGMFINLYISVPSVLNASFWTAPSTWIIRIHMTLGISVLLVAIFLYYHSSKSKISSIATGAGLGFIILSVVAGFAFLFGGANNAFSYFMEVGFVGAVLAYAFQFGSLTGRKAI